MSSSAEAANTDHDLAAVVGGLLVEVPSFNDSDSCLMETQQLPVTGNISQGEGPDKEEEDSGQPVVTFCLDEEGEDSGFTLLTSVSNESNEPVTPQVGGKFGGRLTGRDTSLLKRKASSSRLDDLKVKYLEAEAEQRMKRVARQMEMDKELHELDVQIKKAQLREACANAFLAERRAF